MALTDHASVFTAVGETGINRIVVLAMQQRPSLFNYATQGIIDNQTLLCQPIQANPQVALSGNPLITVENALPVLGTNGKYGLDFCFQLTVASVDFAPGNAISLPPPLNPLPPQSIAAHVSVTGGVACPPASVISTLPPVTDPNIDLSNLGVATVIPTTPPLICFSFDAFVVMSTNLTGQPPNEVLRVLVSGIKLVGLQPASLESVAECYVNLVTQLAILPRLRAVIPTAFHYALMQPPPGFPNLPAGFSLPLTFDIALTPTSTDVPNNPAFEDDQAKVFLNVAVS